MLRILEVPDQLIPKMNIKYPPHQSSNPMIEERCFEYFNENADKIDTDCIYIPIQWTAFHLLNDYGKNLQPLIEYYNAVLDQLPDEKFFTVVQWDGGTLIPLDNCRIFACSGSFSSPIGNNSTYEPVPLLCDPHPVSIKEPKKYKAAFAGRLTHDLRRRMFEVLDGTEGFMLHDPGGVAISDKDVNHFRDITSDSIFGLCPRGYGPTSFRTYETIQMGAIPIIIGDEFWLPFRDIIDWNKLSVMVDENQMHHIPGIVNQLIDSGKYKSMLEYGKFCYDNYFSNNGIPQTLAKIIES